MLWPDGSVVKYGRFVYRAHGASVRYVSQCSCVFTDTSQIMSFEIDGFLSDREVNFDDVQL